MKQTYSAIHITKKVSQVILYFKASSMFYIKILCCQAQYPIIYDWIAIFVLKLKKRFKFNTL